MKKLLIGLTLLISIPSFAGESKTLTKLIIACTKSASTTYKTVEQDKYSSDDYVISIQCDGKTTAKPLYDELNKESYDLDKGEYISIGGSLVNYVLLGDDRIGLSSNQASRCLRISSSFNDIPTVGYKCNINLDLKQSLLKKMKGSYKSIF